MHTRTEPHIHEDRPPCTCDLTKPANCPRHMDEDTQGDTKPVSVVPEPKES